MNKLKYLQQKQVRLYNTHGKEYSLETFHRSNQDTSLFHTPVVMENDWVEAGDLIADCSASAGGELALGKNILVAYMPWEGYNFEDSILISQRLVYEEVYSSIHIERYEFETRETKFGSEKITRNIPELNKKDLKHLDSKGVATLGSFIKEGDILVGRVTPINKKSESTYKNLLYTILEKPVKLVRDSSLRAPRGIKAKVINIQIYFKVSPVKDSLLGDVASKKRGLLKNEALRTGSLDLLPTCCKGGTAKNSEQNSLQPIEKSLSSGPNSHSTFFGYPENKKTTGKKKENKNNQSFLYFIQRQKEELQSGFSRVKEKSSGIFFEKKKKIQQAQIKNKNFFKSETLNRHWFEVSRKVRDSNFLLLNCKGLNARWLTDVFTDFFVGRKKKNLKSSLLKSSFTTFSGYPIFLKIKKKKEEQKLAAELLDDSNYLRDHALPSFFCPKKKKKQQEFTKNHQKEKIKNLFINSLIKTTLGWVSFKNYFWVGFYNAPPKKILLGTFFDSKKKAKVQKNSGVVGYPNNLNKKKNPQELNQVYLYLAEKRKIQVGDKMAGRHGNKGIVSLILPRQDMPFLANGSCLDMVLNPLGVPSRMNVGQIYECLLGLASKYLGEHYKIFPFDEIYGPEASRSFVYSKLYEARKKTGQEWLFNPNNPGKTRIFDGRSGDPFDQCVTVGYAYMLKLVHLVDDKIHMRSTGPYSLVTQQPLRGRSKQGGQRLGEMEVWALEGYGAAFTLLEMLTIKSDDMTGRMTLWSNLILNKDIAIGTPESFKVLVCELQALCLDIGIFRLNSVGNLIEVEKLIQLP